MDMTDDDIRTLIARKNETPNLDYKISVIWDRTHNNDRLEITKDILAMANTRDGGKILLGVDDVTKEYKGLSEESYNSFEVTKLNQFVHNFADPVFTCTVVKRENLDGKRVVVIDIPEFIEDPIVCKDNGHNQKGEIVLVRGGLYIRTKKCTSELVSTADETRGILERGMNKKSDEILAKVSRLLLASEKRKSKRNNKASDKPETPSVASTEPVEPVVYKSDYENEIKEAYVYFDDKLGKKKIEGYWNVIAYPKTYNPKRFSDPVKAHEAVKESIVHLRGWDFPHDDHQNSSNFAKGRQSFTVWEHHNEAWRMYKSGLFIWKQNYWEDSRGYEDEGKKVLSFVSLIYGLTEILLFFKRLYTKYPLSNEMELKITLTDCEGRKLAAFEPGVLISGYYTSGEKTIPMEREISSVELEASAEVIARDIAKEIFMIFNWNNPDDSMIEGWQKKLIERGGM